MAKKKFYAVKVGKTPGIYEEIANMHSRICREEFRTREESNEMLDIVQAVIKLQTHFKENYEKRKESEYYA